MLKRANNIKKKEPKVLHDKTPMVIKLLIIAFDKLSERCSAKPKIKKFYCYTNMLPVVLSLKSDILAIYSVRPKNVVELIKRVDNLEKIIETFKRLLIDLQTVYEQHIFRDEDYNSLRDSLCEAQTQIMKWKNSEKKKLKNSLEVQEAITEIKR